MKKIIQFILIVLAGNMLVVSCKPSSDYERLVKEELATGKQQDTILLGIVFGMKRKDFYNHCWELNKQGLIRQGSGNTTIEYELPNMRSMATLNFFPEFREDTIYEVTGLVKYLAWAPWNKELQVDSLLTDMLNLYEQWYGEDFIHVVHPERGELYVDVDGNRRIILTKANDGAVRVFYSDLRNKEDK